MKFILPLILLFSALLISSFVYADSIPETCWHRWAKNQYSDYQKRCPNGNCNPEREFPQEVEFMKRAIAWNIALFDAQVSVQYNGENFGLFASPRAKTHFWETPIDDIEFNTNYADEAYLEFWTQGYSDGTYHRSYLARVRMDLNLKDCKFSNPRVLSGRYIDNYPGSVPF